MNIDDTVSWYTGRTLCIGNLIEFLSGNKVKVCQTSESIDPVKVWEQSELIIPIYLEIDVSELTVEEF